MAILTWEGAQIQASLREGKVAQTDWLTAKPTSLCGRWLVGVPEVLSSASPDHLPPVFRGLTPCLFSDAFISPWASAETWHLSLVSAASTATSMGPKHGLPPSLTLAEPPASPPSCPQISASMAHVSAGSMLHTHLASPHPSHPSSPGFPCLSGETPPPSGHPRSKHSGHPLLHVLILAICYGVLGTALIAGHPFCCLTMCQPSDLGCGLRGQDAVAAVLSVPARWPLIPMPSSHCTSSSSHS